MKTKGSGDFGGTSDNHIASASHSAPYHAKGTGVAASIARPRGMSGLEIVLSLIRGQDPNTLLDRTKRAWNEYKTDAPDIRDELEEHKKDKSRYTSKVAFLERSDVREWEYEQKGRKPTKPTMTGGRHL